MKTVKLEAFHIIGIAVQTTNKDGKSAQDIGALWQKFMSENIIGQIPNKVDNEIYSVYTDYEGDYTQPYMTLLGCKVTSLDEIPEGMVGKSFDESTYLKYTAKGNLADNIIYDAWSKIWNEDLKRTYVADFEVYGAKAQNPADAEVAIYVGVE